MNVLKSRCSRSVPVRFHQPPLHPCLMYRSLLRWSPIQYAMTQLSSLLPTRDIENWQVSVNWGVSCALLAWLFTSHGRPHWSTPISRLPAFVRVIIIIVVSTSLALLSSTCATASSANTTTSPTTTAL